MRLRILCGLLLIPMVGCHSSNTYLMRYWTTEQHDPFARQSSQAGDAGTQTAGSENSDDVGAFRQSNMIRNNIP